MADARAKEIGASGEVVVAQGTFAASYDEVVTAVADFARDYSLEVDPLSADELRLVPRPDAGANGLFRRHDSIDVGVDSDGTRSTVTLRARMAGLYERGRAWQRRRYTWAAIWLTGGIAGGLANNPRGFGWDDLVLPVIGVLLASRAVRRARGEWQSREDYERNVARALQEVFDRLDG